MFTSWAFGEPSLPHTQSWGYREGKVGRVAPGPAAQRHPYKSSSRDLTCCLECLYIYRQRQQRAQHGIDEPHLR
jgi:hypothetical protein